MMLPFRRRPAPRLSLKKQEPKSSEQLRDVTLLPLRHLDYNLQPLNVESLSHYIDLLAREERFRVH